MRTRAGVHLMFPISHHIDTPKPGEKPRKSGESTVRRQGVTCQKRMSGGLLRVREMIFSYF